MIVKYNRKEIDIPVEKVSRFGKISGLMLKNKETENLLFKFNTETRMRIHSFFVFFPFLAIWTDKKNKVLEFKVVTPFSPSVRPKNKFLNLIEMPVNEKNRKVIDLFLKNDGKSSLLRRKKKSLKRK
jgi:uncharacterized membrane protein (UPF0127 family)